MKHLFLSILLAIFACFTTTAQNPHIKNNILGFEFHTYKTSDLGLENAKNIVEMEKKKYLQNFDGDGLVLEFTKKYKIQKERITNHHYIGRYYNSEYNFLYTKNYKVLQKQVYVKKAGHDEWVTFIFDKKNRIIEQETYLKNSNSISKKFYNYDDSNNAIEKYEFNFNDEKINIIDYKTDSKGNIISKNIKATKFEKHDKILDFTYSGSKVIKVSKKEVLSGKVNDNSKATSNYLYNEKGLVIEDNGNYTESDFNINHNYIYEYEYDTYGNWIAKYKFTTNYGYQNLKDENYKRIINVVLRKITYKKGAVTGETNIDATKIQKYLSDVVTNNPFKTKSAPKKGTFWTRSSEKAVRLYLDGKYIGNQFNLLTILENDFYANDSINNITYKLTNFKLKPKNEAYYKPTIFASNDEVIWYRSKEKSVKTYKNGSSLVTRLNFYKIYGDQFYINDSTTNTFYLLKGFMKKDIQKAFHKAIKIAEQNEIVWIKLENGNYTIVKNGVNITDKTKMVYAKDNNNILIKINNEPKYVMINGANEKANTFFKAKSYSDYLISNPSEGVKEVIPNGFLWKKNQKEQFYIYDNGKIDLSKIEVIGFYQHQFVYDVTHNVSYFLEDFDNKKVNEYYPINRLEGNAFYYKTSDNKLGIFVNGKAVNFKNSRFAKNKIDVIADNLNGTAVYILKDYNNQKVLTLGTVTEDKNYKE